jgi:hypothetical protein
VSCCPRPGRTAARVGEPRGFTRSSWMPGLLTGWIHGRGDLAWQMLSTLGLGRHRRRGGRNWVGIPCLQPQGEAHSGGPTRMAIGARPAIGFSRAVVLRSVLVPYGRGGRANGTGQAQARPSALAGVRDEARGCCKFAQFSKPKSVAAPAQRLLKGRTSEPISVPLFF